MKTTLRTLVLLCTALFTWLTPHAAAAQTVSSVDSVGITVSDMDRSVAFYEHILDFHKIADREVAGERYEHLYGLFGVRLRVVRMQLGDEAIELMQFLAPRGRRIPEDSASNDLWFQHVAIIVSDMDAAYARLRQNNVAHASSGPQRLPDWNPNAGGIRAFYFRDPDDNTLEILQFPPGKGAAKWQNARGQLFLGIDHTAIVVANTDDSLHFYRDTLGMRVAGTSENYGTEQEHLNNVFGARLRITALRAASGAGVELLEYLAPRDGRPMPRDTHASDLWYWQINMRATRKGVDANAGVELPNSDLGFRFGLVIHDPDGHASLLEAGNE
jgi:catechol 2,3-dioxygenase-like lactoylglutathione lyase family enzyme